MHLEKWRNVHYKPLSRTHYACARTALSARSDASLTSLDCPVFIVYFPLNYYAGKIIREAIK